MIEKSISQREAGVLLTKVSGKDKPGLTIDRYWITGKLRLDLPQSVADKIEPVISDILSSPGPEEYRRVDIVMPGDRTASAFFLEPVCPLPELIIAGAGHIGKALSHLGKLIGFEVTVIDNRSEYANAYNLPDADHIIVKDIGKAVEDIEKHGDTYIVIVTRGHGDDAAALKSCNRNRSRLCRNDRKQSQGCKDAFRFYQQRLGVRRSMEPDFCSDRSGNQIEDG